MIRTGRALWRDDKAPMGFFKDYVSELNERGVTVLVTQRPIEPPIPTEIIAQEIAELSAAMKRIDAGKLTRKAIVLLLHAETKLPQKDIRAVLDALPALGKLYLKP